MRVSDDKAGLIEQVEWIDYSAVATDIGQDLTPRVLPASTETRIVIALWSGSARPGVRVSSSGSTDQLVLTVEVSEQPGGDVRTPWPIVVATRREVALEEIELDVIESGPED